MPACMHAHGYINTSQWMQWTEPRTGGEGRLQNLIATSYYIYIYIYMYIYMYIYICKYNLEHLPVGAVDEVVGEDALVALGAEGPHHPHPRRCEPAGRVGRGGAASELASE